MPVSHVDPTPVNTDATMAGFLSPSAATHLADRVDATVAPPQMTIPGNLSAAQGFHSQPSAAPDNSFVNAAQAATVSSNDVDPWIGKALQQYVIDRMLGQGGMGRVYLARHRWLDMPVAIKVLHNAADPNGEALERFRREARLAARLVHPNIVRATDGGPINDTFFLATEYLEGMDLNDYVRQHGPLAIADACWVIAETAKGLACAHDNQLVHRDIKPSNAMLTRRGELKVLDLGLARLVNSDTQLTGSGMMMGTIDYIAPEQAADTRAVDFRSDIYSLGCMFYFLLTGQAPFSGDAYDTVVSKIMGHTSEDPRALNTFRGDVSAALQTVLDRMMAKSPQDRFQSAHEVVIALQAWTSDATLPRRFASHTCHASSALTATQASRDTDRSGSRVSGQKIDDFADTVCNVLWVGLRTMMLAVGLLERQTTQTSSRLSTQVKHTYHFSPKGLIPVCAFAALAMFLWMSGFWIEFGEPV